MPTDFALKLRKNRKEVADSAENNEEYLRNSEKSFLYLSKKRGWMQIDCVKNDKIRSIDDIATEIYNCVFEYLKK
jgi:dTMP kinase